MGMEFRSDGDAARVSGTRARWLAVIRLLLNSDDDPNDCILGRSLERSLKSNYELLDLSADLSEDAYRRVRHADAKLDFYARKFAWRPDMI